jgi:hypothetical protein
MESIFIPGNVPSSKNGRVWTGKYFIASKSVQRWRKESEPFWILHKSDFLLMIKGLDTPYKISLEFVRGSKHAFDYLNPAQTIQDEMVKHGWLEDDNASIVIPVFKPFSYNKLKPGVYVNIVR